MSQGIAQTINDANSAVAGASTDGPFAQVARQTNEIQSARQPALDDSQAALQTPESVEARRDNSTGPDPFQQFRREQFAELPVQDFADTRYSVPQSGNSRQGQALTPTPQPRSNLPFATPVGEMPRPASPVAGSPDEVWPTGLRNNPTSTTSLQSQFDLQSKPPEQLRPIDTSRPYDAAQAQPFGTMPEQRQGQAVPADRVSSTIPELPPVPNITGSYPATSPSAFPPLNEVEARMQQQLAEREQQLRVTQRNPLTEKQGTFGTKSFGPNSHFNRGVTR